MPIVKYTPFADIDDFPTGLRLFQDTMNRLMSDQETARPWSPAVDILETENDLVLNADIPGVELKDVDINLENGTLTLKGERKFEKEEKNKGFHRMERSYGSFVRYFTVPDTVDSEHVRAEYHNGVLTVTLPKKEIAKPKAIKVQVSNN
ncbi:MAG TPA: Hsp20/alpha crystallin family protein [Bryobacteraceae bacterium]|nr:Hsp20/alpha crystallin family protein [Bryobacteraceae bacterium]